MDNVSANASDNAATIIGTTVADGVLLLVVFFTMVLNLFVIAALVGKDNSELVLSIRVILINILAACVIGALNSIMYHIGAPILHLVSSASVHAPQLCRVVVFLGNTSSSGRVLFTAFYGVTVFIVVHFWSRPVLAPRNTKYFVIASSLLWLLALAAGIPALFDTALPTGFCIINTNNTQDTQDVNYSLFVALPYFAVSCIPIIITPIILIETSCYVKRKTISEHKDTKKALVRFGLFLMTVQAFNAFSQIGIPLLALAFSRLQTEHFIGYFIAILLTDLSRVPTIVLILVFFKPVRVKLQRWMRLFFLCLKQATKSRTGAKGGATMNE